MKSRLLCLLLFAFLCPAASAFTQVGDKPTLQFKSIDGQDISLRKLRGKLVVVDFWAATDMGRHIQAKLVELHRRYADQGVAVIGICCDRDLARSKAFMAELGMTWPQYWDGKNWASPLVHAWTPNVQTFLLDPDGTVLWVGPMLRLETEIKAALIQHPPTMVDPEILAKANGMLDAVDKALQEQDDATAIRQFAAVPTEAKENKPFADRYGQTETKVHDASQRLVGKIDELLAQKQFLTAQHRLEDLIKTLDGTPLAGDLRQRLEDLRANPDATAQFEALRRQQEATDALAAARKLRSEEKHEQAYPRFKAIVRDYPNTAAAEEAAKAVQFYEQDAAFVTRLKDEAVAAKAKPLLSIARSYATAQHYAQARERYQEVIDQFPGTTYADTARQELGRLSKD